MVPGSFRDGKASFWDRSFGCQRLGKSELQAARFPVAPVVVLVAMTVAVVAVLGW